MFSDNKDFIRINKCVETYNRISTSNDDYGGVNHKFSLIYVDAGMHFVEDVYDKSIMIGNPKIEIRTTDEVFNTCYITKIEKYKNTLCIEIFGKHKNLEQFERIEKFLERCEWTSYYYQVTHKLQILPKNVK